ncbi:type II secretion system F family protein [Agromyces mediolanus]|uniref:type II secretion system F family protein n=1 Tax=Agromyces mediolanus TaxID=41986 RepID=UPI003832EB8D
MSAALRKPALVDAEFASVLLVEARPAGALLGLALGLGVLLSVAPWLWPRPVAAPRRGGAPILLGRVRDELALAGLARVPLTVVVITSVLIALLGGALVFGVFGVPALAAAAAALGAVLVPAAIRRRANAKRAEYRALWPDVVDHLLASVRAGRSLPEAIADLAGLGPAGVRSAFAEFAAGYARTGDFSGELDRVKHLLADPTADRLLEAVRMAREVGGTELPQVLRTLSSALREEGAIRAEVHARQSWLRNAARLGAAAPWLLLGVLATRPEAVQAYDSAAGAVVIAAGAAITVLAYRLMLAIGRLRAERRWFR